MGLGKMESFLANHIEGFFNKKFSSDLEPVELMHGLEKEIRRQCRGKAGEAAPNNFVITLGTEDYHRLCAQRIIDELTTYVEKQVIVQDCVMDGQLRLSIGREETLSRGLYELTSSYGEAVSEDTEPHTLVLERSHLDPQRPLNLPAEHKFVSLAVTEGPDEEAYLEFGEKQIYIGRRDKNEFILTDKNASRLHAWIDYQRHRHVLHDAQSTNGTFVNGTRVQAACLQPGDEIRIGESLLRYEVI